MQAINIDDLRTSARRRLPRAIFEFIDGDTQDETTLRANQEDFRRWRFRTRTLIDVSTRDQSITLFGQKYASPLILAPTGLAGLFSAAESWPPPARRKSSAYRTAFPRCRPAP